MTYTKDTMGTFLRKILHWLKWTQEHDRFIARSNAVAVKSEMTREEIALRLNWLRVVVQQRHE